MVVYPEEGEDNNKDDAGKAIANYKLRFRLGHGVSWSRDRIF